MLYVVAQGMIESKVIEKNKEKMANGMVKSIHARLFFE